MVTGRMLRKRRIVTVAIISVFIVALVTFTLLQTNPVGELVGSTVNYYPTLAEESTITETNPSGQFVSYRGIFHIAGASPVCTSTTCAQNYRAVAYLSLGSGQTFLLVGPKLTPSGIADGSEVIVNGVFVTPSSWPTTQYTPTYNFEGDIYVQQICMIGSGCNT